jgi:hypothetical protein
MKTPRNNFTLEEEIDHDLSILKDIIDSYEEEAQDLDRIKMIEEGLLLDLKDETPDAVQRVYDYFCSLAEGKRSL